MTAVMIISRASLDRRPPYLSHTHSPVDKVRNRHLTERKTPGVFVASGWRHQQRDLQPRRQRRRYATAPGGLRDSLLRMT